MDYTVLEYKGFKARIMEAERLEGDCVHNLPPGVPLKVYHADSFKKLPENWMKGAGVFVVPVRPNKGLWFDWTQNDALNTAVLPTVKGCNPITGVKTEGFHLEQYDNKCPKHSVEFQGDRYCPECGYKWPPKNYVFGGSERAWWDGYRSDDGHVRQFFFTEDELRDVASHMIGKENTVPAFGFAFYSPKERRSLPEVDQSRETPTLGAFPLSTYPFHSAPGIYYQSPSYPAPPFFSDSGGTGNLTYKSLGSFEINCCVHNDIKLSNSAGEEFQKTLTSSVSSARGLSAENVMRSSENFRTKIKEKGWAIKGKKNVEVSIGAGAKIRQDIHPDPYGLDTWKDIPDASMVIYFVFQEKFEELKAGGMVDLNGVSEGMLSGIPVG